MLVEKKRVDNVRLQCVLTNKRTFPTIQFIDKNIDATYITTSTLVTNDSQQTKTTVI